MSTVHVLERIYQRLYAAFGPQHWWPGDSPFEVMVGAVLTQNTNWTNVSRAIDNLKAAGVLSFAAMAAMPEATLADYIRPSGYYNLKARRLQNLLTMIAATYGTDLDRFFNQPQETLRQALLGVKGIGPETADSILLYAAAKPVFVIDAYTHRLLLRHNLIDEEADYYAMQELFTDALPAEQQLYNEYHALIVRVGKEFCRKRTPLCERCPLHDILKL